MGAFIVGIALPGGAATAARLGAALLIVGGLVLVKLPSRV